MKPLHHWLILCVLPVALRADDPPTYVGPEKCVDCHTAEHGVWQKSAHSKGFQFFEERNADKVEEILEAIGSKAKSMEDEATCVKCHLTGNVGEAPLAAISCERCHGAAGPEGTGWLRVHTSFGKGARSPDDEVPAHKAERITMSRSLGMRRSDQLYDIAANCMSCHGLAHPDVDAIQLSNMMEAGHPLKQEYELVKYSQGEVRHRFYPVSTLPGPENQDSPPAHLAQLFVAGQLAKLVSAARSLDKSVDEQYGNEQLQRFDEAAKVLKHFPEAAGLLEEATDSAAAQVWEKLKDQDLLAKVQGLLPSPAEYVFSEKYRSMETPASTTSSLAGTWQGKLGAGDAALRLVLSIANVNDVPEGVLESLDQGATLPVDAIERDAEKLTLRFTSIEARFEGIISPEGTTLNGTWTQQEIPQTLNFQRVTARESTWAVKLAGLLDSPLDVVVPMPPTAVTAGGRKVLAYELHVTNHAHGPVRLARLEVLDAGSQVKLLGQAGLELWRSVQSPGVAEVGLERLRLDPGQVAVVHVWVSLDDVTEVPSSLINVLSLEGDLPITRCRPIPVRTEILTLGPPLQGTGWRAANGPSNTSGHRRALIPVGGQATIAQRFAIDWIRVAAGGAAFSGDPAVNASYLAYGSPALAVADATVISVKDGIPDNTPGIDSRAVPITLETVSGNHVVLQLTADRFAFYAHLQPGSLKVKVGDKVTRGQVLGLVGNSGNSTEPHLHFHVSDGPSPLGAQGIPYLLDTGATTSSSLPVQDEAASFP